MVLLGSSGSGKSTILQLKYLKALEDWKINYFALHKFGHRRQFETKMELNQQILNAKA